MPTTSQPCRTIPSASLLAQGAEALTMTPGETAAYIKSEVAKRGKVVEASGARVE